MLRNFPFIMIFNGREKADEILRDLKQKIQKEKLIPRLAVISVGRDPASELFIKNKRRAAVKIGIKVDHFRFKEKTLEREIVRKIERLNNNTAVHGIIVQLPLPQHLGGGKIVGKMNPCKDVDGFRRKTKFSSPLISAILTALRASDRNLKNKKIVAVVNSDFFGRALKKNLKKEKIKIDYLLGRKLLKYKIKEADIIITVCGRPNLIKGDMIKKGAILIDGGITVLKSKKIVGDVDRKSVEEKAVFLTPVPGGTGPLTVAYLLKNVYLAAKNYGVGH